jgi:hypothetical protein
MRSFFSAALIFTILCISAPAITQEEQAEPTFPSISGLMYETFKGIDRPLFNEYFALLVEKFEGNPDAGWSIWNENMSVAYRITGLPEGLHSVAAITERRQTGFQEFTEEERALWDKAWQTRQVQLYNAIPALSYVPEGFTMEDMRQLPWRRVEIHHVEWDQAPAWRAAVARMNEINREYGIDNMVVTVWGGGLGTTAMSFMVRSADESQEAYRANRMERNGIREAHREEIRDLFMQMNAATRHIERHDQTVAPNLSRRGTAR